MCDFYLLDTPLERYEHRLQKNLEFNKHGIIKNFTLNFDSKAGEKIEKLTQELDIFKRKAQSESIKRSSTKKKVGEDEDDVDVDELKREIRDLTKKLEHAKKNAKTTFNEKSSFKEIVISLNVCNLTYLGVPSENKIVNSKLININ